MSTCRRKGRSGEETLTLCRCWKCRHMNREESTVVDDSSQEPDGSDLGYQPSSALRRRQNQHCYDRDKTRDTYSTAMSHPHPIQEYQRITNWTKIIHEWISMASLTLRVEISRRRWGRPSDEDKDRMVGRVFHSRVERGGRGGMFSTPNLLLPFK
jgi:hypothetical protein